MADPLKAKYGICRQALRYEEDTAYTGFARYLYIS